MGFALEGTSSDRTEISWASVVPIWPLGLHSPLGPIHLPDRRRTRIDIEAVFHPDLVEFVELGQLVRMGVEDIQLEFGLLG